MRGVLLHLASWSDDEGVVSTGVEALGEISDAVEMTTTEAHGHLARAERCGWLSHLHIEKGRMNTHLAIPSGL